MILTVDIGNTNMEYGVFDQEGNLFFESRIATTPYRMCDEYAIGLADILKLYNCNPSDIEGSIISSVVPPATGQVKQAIEKVCNGCRVMVVSPGMKTGLNIKIDDPSSLGGDLAAVSVGAKKLYPLPVIIADLGTATKVLAIDANGTYLGGVITTGVKISSEALAAKTAALPLIGLNSDPIKHVIGTNTIDSIRSGLLVGTACMLDGLIERFESELGTKCTVVATGGFAPVIEPLCKREMIVNQNLIEVGLYEMYKKNR